MKIRNLRPRDGTVTDKPALLRNNDGLPVVDPLDHNLTDGRERQAAIP